MQRTCRFPRFAWFLFDEIFSRLCLMERIHQIGAKCKRNRLRLVVGQSLGVRGGVGTPGCLSLVASHFAPTVRSARKGPFRSRARRSPIGRLASAASASRSGPFRIGASARGRTAPHVARARSGVPVASALAAAQRVRPGAPPASAGCGPSRFGGIPPARPGLAPAARRGVRPSAVR